MAILAVNAGSSSLKFSLHPLQDGQVQPHVLSGCVQGLEPGGSPVMDWKYQGQKQQEALAVPAGAASSFAVALERLRVLVQSLQGADIQAVAHRVVHGGGVFTESVYVTDAVLEQLARFNSLAPLHQPHNLAGIRQFRAAFPELPQVACFDTAFHANMPEVDYAFALPRALREQGVRRYGFHGLSYQYVMSVLHAQTLRGRGRVVMAHLGNGASLCACKDGVSVATTMGFSALDGLMMGTRSGSLDAGVLLYLLEQGWTRERIEKLLYKQSGLLGVSGISSDMRELAASDRPEAREAIDLFIWRAAREAGALASSLGGLDGLVFTAGIGENDAAIRAGICERLAWLDISLDERANAVHADVISAPGSPITVRVIPTDEERMIVLQTLATLFGVKT